LLVSPSADEGIVRVLLVDDHEVVRDGLAVLLAADGTYEVVGSAATGESAILQTVRYQPDIVLLDFRLPDLPGHRVCRAIRRMVPGVLVVMLSSYAGGGAVKAAIAAGAAGFVTKDAGLGALRRALDEIVAGSNEQPFVVDAAGASAGAPPVVSEQDRQLLELAARGLSDREIARDLHLAESTVRFHLQKLKGKLGAVSKTGLVAMAIRSGIIGLDDGDRIGA
jgi:DNA-binding NarL/FixJ family response regulator